MDKLFSFVGDISDPRIGGGDTFVDRINCRYTPSILLIFALLITTKTYVGEPIACWCPDHFTSSQVDFTNQVCWVYNTYYLPFDEVRIPKRGEPRSTIGYYQWVSLLLGVMAVLFYMPRMIWRALNTKSGVAITSITDAAIDCQKKMDCSARDKTLRFMTKHMGRFLRDLNRSILLAGKTKTFFYKMYGNYLLVCLLLVKICYFGNVIGQLFLLNHFLGTKYSLYGIDILQRLIDGKSLSDSKRFPRVTMCDIDIRVLGNVQPYAVMCALPVNLFNEIIFIFIWFWLVVVAIATVASFIYWFFISVVVPHQTSFIKARLIAMDKLGAAPDHMVRTFVENYLRSDGILIIQLVAENSSDIISAELICGLWDQYRDDRRTTERLGENDNLDSDDDDESSGPKKMPFEFTPIDSDKEPSDTNELRERKPASQPFSITPWGANVHNRPPIPPKPNLDDVDNDGPRHLPFRMSESAFEPKVDKKLKEKKEKEKLDKKDRKK